MDTVDAPRPMNLGHGLCPARCAFARRRVARLIDRQPDRMLCQKQSQMAWARARWGGSASNTTRAGLLRRPHSLTRQLTLVT